MPRVKRQPARRLLQQASGGSSTTSLSVVDIEDEIDRWNGVKTAHTLLNDMQVAKMLLDCYDLIGADALGWTNKEPPQSDEALELLKQKADVGLQTLQEIRTLIAMPPKKAEKEEVKEAKEEENVAPTPTRKSKRKTTKVQHIKEEVDPDFFVSLSLQEAVEESGADVRESGEGASEEIPDEEKVPPGDDDPSSDWEVENSKGKTEADSQPKPQTGRKRGRPKRGEEPPKKEPKKPRLPKEPKEPKRKPKKEKVPKEPTEPKKPRIKEVKDRSGSQPVMPGHVIYQCSKCSVRIEKSKEEFQKHYAIHGEEEVAAALTANGKFDVAKAAKLFFYCIKCDMVTHNRASHFSVKHSVVKEKTRVCDICGVSCNTFNKWRYHKQSHIKSNKRFLCPICTKPFRKKPLLQAHIKRHSNKREYICDLCGKVLKTKETLRRHKQTHLKLKPLTCETCGKGFTSGYNLKCHMRSHTGEKPYRCDICPSVFAHRISLRSHKKSVHGMDILDTQYLIDEYQEEVVKANKGKAIEVEGVPDEEMETAAADNNYQETITIEVRESEPTEIITTTEIGAETTVGMNAKPNVVVETCSSKLEEEVVQTLTREFPSIGVIAGGQGGQPASSYVIPVSLTEPGSHSFLVHVPAVEPNPAQNQQKVYQTL